MSFTWEITHRFNKNFWFLIIVKYVQILKRNRTQTDLIDTPGWDRVDFKTVLSLTCEVTLSDDNFDSYLVCTCETNEIQHIGVLTDCMRTSSKV